jgi:hypothetical protein
VLANENRVKEEVHHPAAEDAGGCTKGRRRAMKPTDAEAWEKHMRLERELLAQRRDGKLAKAIGKALPGESPQDLEQMAREDRSKAEEGLVSLLWGGQLSYKHIDKLTPENLLARLEAEREQVNWLMGRLQSLQQTKGRGVGEQDTPTREEFEAAKRREVSRLNVRVAPMLGGLPTPEDLEVLWLDEPTDELRDKDIVRRWVAAKKREP